MDFMCGGTARGYTYTTDWYGVLRPHFQVCFQALHGSIAYRLGAMYVCGFLKLEIQYDVVPR